MLCDFFLLFMFENDVNAPSKNNKQKYFYTNKLFFVGNLKVNEETSRIRIRIRVRIRIRIHLSRVSDPDRMDPH